MTPILPELVNAVIEERIRQAQMRNVARSTTRASRRIHRHNLRWLDRMSELSRADVQLAELDQR